MPVVVTMSAALPATVAVVFTRFEVLVFHECAPCHRWC
jgi:hypothetical protein